MKEQIFLVSDEQLSSLLSNTPIDDNILNRIVRKLGYSVSVKLPDNKMVTIKSVLHNRRKKCLNCL